MVSFSRLLPKVVLPQMYHFMREGCEHLIRFPGGKVGWIKRNLIGYFFRVCSIYEALPGEEAESALMPLHCYQARRQTAGKEFPVEEIICGSQTCICLCCWIVHN
jgi:hypothetical protein